MMDEERSSMIPTMAAGLNSILFAINIDNKDLNGQSKCPPTVSDLLKESTQNVTSLLKESTQGVSSLFKEITASSPVSILMKSEQDADPLPILSKSVSGELKYRKERIKKKKKITNIILFDEEDEQHIGNVLRVAVTGENSEQNSDRSLAYMASPSVDLVMNLNGDQRMALLKNDSVHLNGECTFPKLDVKSIDDEDVEENDETYGEMSGTHSVTESCGKSSEVVTSSSLVCAWTPLKILNDDSDELFPFTTISSFSHTDSVQNDGEHECADFSEEVAQRNADLHYSRVDVRDPAQENIVNNVLPSTKVPESMTVGKYVLNQILKI
ncbi:putative protein SNX29P2 isoform X2 [Sceloporus undulatus]|uniref:putative protein SNX29P2 isoform X2 n=1 Tax=Sceloporus undulatus TaxID=8520 RepID=UPI001C4B30FB|nr:putative protein SNX29P2 isoform X2 [Sceloporus undulatus]